MAWREVAHPEYLRFRGIRVRGYDFSARRDDGGISGLVIQFESGSADPVRREIEELTGLDFAITQITTKDGVGAEAVNALEMRMLGKVFFTYLEEEIDLSVTDIKHQPTGWYRILFSRTPTRIGDLPHRPHRQKQPSLDFFGDNYCKITP